MTFRILFWIDTLHSLTLYGAAREFCCWLHMKFFVCARIVLLLIYFNVLSKHEIQEISEIKLFIPNLSAFIFFSLKEIKKEKERNVEKKKSEKWNE